MLLSLSLVFLVGMAAAEICRLLKLPRIIGMLFTGVVLGPYVLDLLNPALLNISAELRRIALIIILIKAGLSLDLHDLRKVGRPALLMSFVPASFEIAAFILLGPHLLGMTLMESAVTGAVLSAVSPAVVVPRMVMLMEKKYGTQKGVPQLILAGASLDDVFVIVLFSAFVSMAQGNTVCAAEFIKIPVQIVLGILIGAVTGFLLSFLFETAYAHKLPVRNSMKVIVILGVSFLLVAAEEFCKPYVPFSALLAVMSMACMVRIKSIRQVAQRLSAKFGKLWIAAEVLLFVLVGAAVDIRFTMQAGKMAVLIIFGALLFRSLGVLLCLARTDLCWKERFFCVLAYLPKATVQAAIGSVPLSLGLPCGRMVLSIAVLAIIITAPLGAISMDASYARLLQHQE